MNSKGRHEASDVELLIVQTLKKPLSIGNTTPPKVVLEGKSGFVSHTKLIAEATFMDLFHS